MKSISDDRSFLLLTFISTGERLGLMLHLFYAPTLPFLILLTARSGSTRNTVFFLHQNAANSAAATVLGLLKQLEGA